MLTQITSLMILSYILNGCGEYENVCNEQNRRDGQTGLIPINLASRSKKSNGNIPENINTDKISVPTFKLTQISSEIISNNLTNPNLSGVKLQIGIATDIVKSCSSLTKDKIDEILNKIKPLQSLNNIISLYKDIISLCKPNIRVLTSYAVLDINNWANNASITEMYPRFYLNMYSIVSQTKITFDEKGNIMNDYYMTNYSYYQSKSYTDKEVNIRLNLDEYAGIITDEVKDNRHRTIIYQFGFEDVNSCKIPFKTLVSVFKPDVN